MCNEQQTPPPPIETNLELVDDDDHLVSDHHTDTGGSTPHTSDSQLVTEPRRYPARHHKPPARL